MHLSLTLGNESAYEARQDQRIYRINLAYTFGSVFLCLFVSFIFMWAIVLARLEQPITQTFSFCLARDETAQIIFASWWSYYLVASVLTWCIVVERCKVHHLSTREVTPKTTILIVVWYILLNLVKIVALFMLLVYPDLDDTRKMHFIFVQVAFVCAIIASFVAFCLRVVRKELQFFLLVLNSISVVVQVAMSIMFIHTPLDNRGIYEFVIALLIVLDVGFILLDFVFDFLKHFKTI